MLTGSSAAQMHSEETSNNIPSFLGSTGMLIDNCQILLAASVVVAVGQHSMSTDEKQQGVAGLGKLLKGSKGREIQACSRKCLPACLRGGEGAPGLGPMTVRRELIAFKDGFRDRKYCLTECTTVCALSFNGDPGVQK